jgi:hypothetical protein
LLIIGALALLINTLFAVTGLSQPPQTRNAYEAYYLHTGTYPCGAVSWGEDQIEVQGITHDDSNWYITATDRAGLIDKTIDNAFLWKIPVKDDLNLDAFHHPDVTYKTLYDFPALWNHNCHPRPPCSDTLTGYVHWGDLDHYKYNSIDYLVVPMTSPSAVENNVLAWGDPAVVVFRGDDLSLVGYGLLPGKSGTGQKDVGWCAIDPRTGDLYTSPDHTSEVLGYEMPWSSLSVSGYSGPFTITYNGFHRDFMDGIADTALDLHNMQGGEFTPSGELLYISNGGGHCAGAGADDAGWPTDGIHAFETLNWREIKHSTNRCYDPNLRQGTSNCDHPQSDYFDLSYDFDCGFWEFHAEQPEGLTIWDLYDGRAPGENGGCAVSAPGHVSGQLHVLVASVGTGNMASLEHFGSRLHVDGVNGEDTPAWTVPLMGTKERPFKFVSDAINWYPAWHGAQIAIMVPGSTVPSILTMQDIVVYEIGPAPTTMQQGQPFPDLSIRLYNVSSPPVAGSVSIDFFLSPDPVAPGSPATDNDVDLGVFSAKVQLGRGEYQSVLVSGVKVPCNLPPGSYYLGTSVNGGPASSPSNPILIDIKADVTPPDLKCPGDLTVECSTARGTPRDDSQLTPLFADVAAHDDCGATITNDSPSLFPLGTTRVTFVATDTHGNSSQCTANVTVEDTTPPVIVTRKQEIVYWPPDHKYDTINVQDFVASVTDVCDDSIGVGSIRVLSVASDEAEDAFGEGDGSTLQDAIIMCPNTVQVRAEREGASNGRVYRVTYAATDHSGNRATVVCMVHVPHDKSDGIAIEGPGSGYVVYGSCDVLRQIPLDSDPLALDPDRGLQPTMLLQNYPNPFNPRTRIEFSLQQSVLVSLKVYNVQGEVVASLVSEQLPAGDYSFEWDATGLPSGVYLSRLEAGAFTQSKKFLLLK